jgi:tetratricopeptide (TPR) repeat protein
MKRIISCIFLLALITGSCKKDFLDKRPDKSLLIPQTLSDFEKMLNNDQVMGLSPEINQISSDDYFTTEDGLSSFYSATERNSYTWAKDVYEGSDCGDWYVPYQQVYYANVVLEGLGKTTENDSDRKIQLKGEALFHRAFAFYNLAQLFCKPYDAAGSATDPGIPLHLSAEIGGQPGRGSVEDTYAQVLKDLSEARQLVANEQTVYKNIGKQAVNALMARVYLTMGNYEKAGDFAGESLSVDNRLINYNTLYPTDYRPFPAAPLISSEMLFYSRLVPYSFDVSSAVFIDSALYRSYADNDLRKVIFFEDNGEEKYYFKGTYTGSDPQFGGGAKDELYLIAAECAARRGAKDDALKLLNDLLVTRFRAGTYKPLQAATADEALRLVIAERRKELVSRGLRWTDLRRLNKDPRFAVTLSRNINGTVITLPPNDNRYVFPIPVEEIRASGIAQNPR